MTKHCQGIKMCLKVSCKMLHVIHIYSRNMHRIPTTWWARLARMTSSSWPAAIPTLQMKKNEAREVM